MERGLVLRAICLGVVITVIGIFILPTVTCAQEKVVKLRYSNFFPPVHAISKLSEEWCKEVEKRTNGRVKISSFRRRHAHAAHADLRQYGKRH